MKPGMTLLHLVCLGILSTTAVSAEVKLSSIYSDHMILQRNLPVVVRGSADSDEMVSVTFRGETRKVTPDKFGRWETAMSPGTAGGPFIMEVKGKNSIRVSDILVGDVWVASGQSNMEFFTSGVINAEAELKTANLPKIRLLRILPVTSPYPLDDLSAIPWVVCSPVAAAHFSAVAFFFGREVQSDQKVPIGLIDSTWGGTPVEAWTSVRALAEDASLMPAFAYWAHVMDDESKLIPEKAYENLQSDLAIQRGLPKPELPDHPDMLARSTPGGLYNAMIAPLTHFPIRGVIWYQGESNGSVEQAPHYARLFQTLIQDWRRNWAEGDFPFLYVQLANLKTNLGDGWPEVREAQRESLVLKNTGMVVTIDIGDPEAVHFADKQDVGHRLALVARAIAYHEPIEYSGPLFRMQSRDDQALRIWFDHSEGLMAKGVILKGFQIAGKDGKFLPADAQIDGQCVIVSNREILEPAIVRYAWKDNPGGNLYNGAGLPASPFQSRKY
ncbi:MAG TPA: sialate O-acetylesterase [Acidobacteriaceae bacterium]